MSPFHSVFDNPYYVNEGQIKGLYFIHNLMYEIKVRLLGSSFIEGTWAGYVQGGENGGFFIVETYDQSYTAITATGTRFTRLGEIHSRWESKSVNLNRKTHTLVQENACTLPRSAQIFSETAFYSLRIETMGKPPKRMEGFMVDARTRKRRTIREEKASDGILAHREDFLLARDKYRHLVK